MSIDSALALIGFAYVMSVSPGPGNFLLLASGVNFGYRRSLPLVFGISLGFLTMVFVLGIGVGEVLRQVPEILIALRLICGAYVLYLAWKIAHIRSLGSGAGPTVDAPIGFIQAALFQLVNPKAWAVALILGVSYTDPNNYLVSLIILIAVFAVVNVPTISIWAISGQALRRLLASDRRLRFFNLFMALLLVGTMVPVLAGVYAF